MQVGEGGAHFLVLECFFQRGLVRRLDAAAMFVDAEVELLAIVVRQVRLPESVLDHHHAVDDAALAIGFLRHDEEALGRRFDVVFAKTETLGARGRSHGRDHDGKYERAKRAGHISSPPLAHRVADPTRQGNLHPICR